MKSGIGADMEGEYRPRVVDSLVERHLQAFGAVLLEGPKWCGKTWTGRHHSRSEISIGDPAGGFQNRQLAAMNPALVLDGEAPRLIDEWQEEPTLWDAVRMECDRSCAKGRFVLTGSATLQRKGILHSGAGRISRIRMRPMALYESGESSGLVSLEEICRGHAPDVATGDVALEWVIGWIVRGGWPENIGVSLSLAAMLPEQYIAAILEDDASRVEGKRRDPRKMRLLLRSLARNESTTATGRTLKRDIQAAEADDVDIDTIAEYLALFSRLHLIDNQLPFSTSMRSATRVKQQEKRHLADPSLAAALLGATPEKLAGDLKTLGFLFEALAERDLRIYAESFGGALWHYQDYRGKEIDAVVEMPDGSWCAIEVKLGAGEIDAAAKNLLTIRAAFAADPTAREPAALCVVCALSKAAYMRPDGVYVVPLSALRP